MKKTITTSLIILVCAFSACKKSSSSAPSIVGTWAFSNISGTSVSASGNPSSSQTTTYSFNHTTDTLTETIVSNSPFSPMYSYIFLSKELWTFNNDGTYIINETFSYVSGNGPSATNVETGNWEYLSNTQVDNAFFFDGGFSSVLPYYYNGFARNFKISNNTLVVTMNNSQVSSGGDTTINNITMTFTKQ